MLTSLAASCFESLAASKGTYFKQISLIYFSTQLHSKIPNISRHKKKVGIFSKNYQLYIKNIFHTLPASNFILRALLWNLYVPIHYIYTVTAWLPQLIFRLCDLVKKWRKMEDRNANVNYLFLNKRGIVCHRTKAERATKGATFQIKQLFSP